MLSRHRNSATESHGEEKWESRLGFPRALYCAFLKLRLAAVDLHRRDHRMLRAENHRSGNGRRYGNGRR